MLNQLWQLNRLTHKQNNVGPISVIIFKWGRTIAYFHQKVIGKLAWYDIDYWWMRWVMTHFSCSPMGVVHFKKQQSWWRQWFDMWKEWRFHLAQKNLLHSLPWLHLFSVVSPLCRVGNPLSIPEKLFLDYPVITSTSRLTHYARVEDTTH
jgi:hypothetical protein